MKTRAHRQAEIDAAEAAASLAADARRAVTTIERLRTDAARVTKLLDTAAKHEHAAADPRDAADQRRRLYVGAIESTAALTTVQCLLDDAAAHAAAVSPALDCYGPPPYPPPFPPA